MNIPTSKTESNPNGFSLRCYAVMRVFSHYDDPIEVDCMRVFSNIEDAEQYKEILDSVGAAFCEVVMVTTSYVQ